MFVRLIELVCIAFHFVPQKFRHWYGAVALWGLGRRYNVLWPDSLKWLCDGDGAGFQINVTDFQCQQFADSHTAVVEHQEPGSWYRLVRNVGQEDFKLVRCPELHFLRMTFSDAACCPAGIIFQTVVPHGIIHNSRKLIVNGFQIGLWERLSVFVGVWGQFILPFPDSCGRDLWYSQLSEERQQFGVYDILFLDESILPETVLHVLIVELYKIFKGHGKITLLCFQKVPLPLLGILLAFESALFALPFGAAVVCIIALDIPCLGAGVLIYWHKKQSFLFVADCAKI